MNTNKHKFELNKFQSRLSTAYNKTNYVQNNERKKNINKFSKNFSLILFRLFSILIMVKEQKNRAIVKSMFH